MVARPIQLLSSPVTNIVLSFCLYLSLVRGTNIGLFYPPDEFLLATIDYTAQTIMNFVLLAGVLVLFFLGNNYSFLIKSMSVGWFALIVGGMLASLAFSVDKIQSLKYMVAIAAITLPTILYSRQFGPDQLLAALSRFVVAMAFINLAYVLVFPEYGIMVERHAGRWRGMFEHKNFSGPFFALGFFIVFYHLRRTDLVQFALQAAALLICFAFVAMSQSSTALVAFAVMGASYATFFFLFRLPNPKDRVALFLGTISTLILIGLFWGDQIESLFFSLTGKDATLTGRTGIWAVILDLVAKRPLTGFGPGMSERPEFMDQIQASVGWDAKGTHNSYLDLLVNYGYPAAILMTFYILKTWLSYFTGVVPEEKRRSGAFSACLILTVLLVGGANAATLFSRSILWIFVVAGLTVIAARPPIKASLEMKRRSE